MLNHEIFQEFQCYREVTVSYPAVVVITLRLIFVYENVYRFAVNVNGQCGK